jgi:hypothetical protein
MRRTGFFHEIIDLPSPVSYGEKLRAHLGRYLFFTRALELLVVASNF